MLVLLLNRTFQLVFIKQIRFDSELIYFIRYVSFLQKELSENRIKRETLKLQLKLSCSVIKFSIALLLRHWALSLADGLTVIFINQYFIFVVF